MPPVGVARYPLSIQDLDSKQRKYLYMTFTVADDGKLLSMKGVKSDVIPKDSKDAAGVQRLLTRNLQNPALFDKDILQFTRDD